MSKNGYLQIHDPLKPRGQAVGIDLGTTNSLVASVVHGKPRCVPVDEGDSLLLPSVVHYAKDGGVVVGARARRLAPEHPTDTISSVKRFMGRSPDDAETRKLGHYRFVPGSKVVRFDVAGGTPVNPIEVSGEILRALKRRAEAHFSTKVEQAVITVPAYFDDAQRQATKDAGRLAGLEVLRLLNEPTAAALAYGLDKGSQGTFAVYDLGGGTFDVSILKLVDGVFEVKSTGGDSALGGDDFDRAIAQHVLQAMGASEPSPALVAEVLAASRKAKEALTDAPEVELSAGGHTQVVKRADFDAWIQPLVQKTGVVCRRALKDAGVAAGELDGVILVGGATRVPAVRRYVAELFGREPLGDIDPDQVVALGAAVQADLLTNADRQDEVLLLDVIPLSLGLETMGGIVEKLIQRNSTIPTAAAQVFTTFKDGQTGLDVHVVQGERELVEDNRSLARFTLSGIPALAAGMARVEVRFQVDADGILSVSAKEQSTGATQSITVKPSHGLSDEEIEQMLLDSIDHAEEDIQARQVREQRVDAERVLAEAERQLREHGSLLQDGERAAIDAAMARVRELSAGNDHLKLKEAVHALDETSRPFIERVMNQAITQVVGGHSVEEF
ncbi:Fe-S protein assembly chaperone HscA [Myxococcus sp. RHSTA-1-4]|uniref:Fe-S protein assembly chaperone HscA n=1 Tax=Myxococcus sp. RHSTA-1-4 TaxID=2874601 RepID=UPI001CC19A8A|nr:Fe-S protein assembly chaperone HscA [Myxococcus sp. RHSTA-1-4]